jgi:hypothetical protein
MTNTKPRANNQNTAHVPSSSGKLGLIGNAPIRKFFPKELEIPDGADVLQVVNDYYKQLANGLTEDQFEEFHKILYRNVTELIEEFDGKEVYAESAKQITGQWGDEVIVNINNRYLVTVKPNANLLKLISAYGKFTVSPDEVTTIGYKIPIKKYKNKYGNIALSYIDYKDTHKQAEAIRNYRVIKH